MYKQIYQEISYICYHRRTLNIDVLNNMSKINIDVLEKKINVLRTSLFFPHYYYQRK